MPRRVDHSTGPARTLFIVGTFYASLHLALRPQSNSLFPHMSDANNYHPLLMVPFHGWVGKGTPAAAPGPRFHSEAAGECVLFFFFFYCYFFFVCYFFFFSISLPIFHAYFFLSCQERGRERRETERERDILDTRLVPSCCFLSVCLCVCVSCLPVPSFLPSFLPFSLSICLSF